MTRLVSFVGVERAAVAGRATTVPSSGDGRSLSTRVVHSDVPAGMTLAAWGHVRRAARRRRWPHDLDAAGGLRG